MGGGTAVEAWVALVAGMLDRIRGLGVPDVCPGDWAWSVTALGVLTGLIPTAGAVTVSLLRRRIGSGSASGYGPAESVLLAGIGLLAAGLLPLAVFHGAGGVFAVATAGETVPGLSAETSASIRVTTCSVVGTQSSYLGLGSVGGSIGSGDLVRSVTAIVLLGVVPLLAVMLVAVQARTALRRGPRWPAKFFWLPLFALIVLTASVPSGTAEHLWVGILAAGLFGVILVPMVPPPSQRTIERIRAGRDTPPSRSTPSSPGDGSSSSRAGRTGAGAARPSAVTATPSVAERLADRFARRETPHEQEQRSAAQSGAGAPVAPYATFHPQQPPGTGGPPYAGFGPGPSGYAGGPPSGARPPGPPGRPPTGPAAHPAAGPMRAGAPPLPPPGGPPRRPTTIAPVPGGPVPGRAPRFRLLKRLGAGGFGGVWLAHDAKLGHTVAVKSAHAADPETEERIRREAAALGSMRHPCCVEIYDLLHASSDPGLQGMDGLVIVMQYVDGMSLGQLVAERGTVDDVSAARIWTGIAGALDTAHRGGVLHRDIKPGNIVVDPQGHPHLIDFGIARKQGDSTLTQTGYVLGTPDYLAPEAAAGKPASPASDGWQLAAAVSFALSGHPPRGEASDAVAGLRAAASGAKLTHLPARTAHLSLLKQAMRTEPHKRPELATIQAKLDTWLQRQGYRADGPVTAMLDTR
ncbi:serine/threonine-protein kinase [Pseudonocardia nematodicida]|uniref:non-specific serine/threonine protein kinase n=1 Tax=Pseudonocardia nematodicida TaxID=1206997 RepID=A0ABV1K453_9PSEU